MSGREQAHHLFVRWPQHESTFSPVVQAKEHRIHRCITARLHPGLARLQRRQVDFLGPASVHFLPDYLFDLPVHAPTERCVAVDTGGDRNYQPRPQQQLVTREFGLGRGLPQRL